MLKTEILLVSGYLLWSLAERTQLDCCVKQEMLVIVVLFVALNFNRVLRTVMQNS